MMECAMQLTYTWLFGFLAFLIMARRGLLAAMGAHCFCNVMGLPDLSFMSKRYGRVSVLYPYRFVLLSIYVVGIALFIVSLARAEE